MHIKMNDYVVSENKQTYITENLQAGVRLPIDCGEGINILQIPPHWLATFADLDLERIRTYPHTPELKAELVKYWRDCTAVNQTNVFITEGSMDGIRIACRLFLERGDWVLGNIPTFNAAESEIKLSGALYDGVQLAAENNYVFNGDVFLQRLDSRHKMVFIDNPNNPTGQVIPLDQIRRIAAAAARLGIGVVIDEAYGDYMAKENSAINLLDCFENIVVLRTFSKGFGLAGMRIGYLFASSGELAQSLSKVTDAYSVCVFSRLLAQAALDDLDFLQQVNEKAKELKVRLRTEPWQNLTVSATGENVPIMLLSHRDSEVNLAAALAERGIKAISGKEFSGTDKNSARFRIPQEGDFQEVVEALREVDGE